MIKNDKQIEIPLSKIKMILMFIGALAFIAIGMWFIIDPPEMSYCSGRRVIFGNPGFLFIIGVISILFFGFVAVFIFKKLLDKKAGLIINQKGIIDNSSGLSIGLILWSDIQGIETIKVNNQKFIMLILKNPQNYLDKVTNKLKRKGMEVNCKWYGSPISISANTLQINHKDLYTLLSEKMKQYKE